MALKLECRACPTLNLKDKLSYDNETKDHAHVIIGSEAKQTKGKAEHEFVGTSYGSARLKPLPSYGITIRKPDFEPEIPVICRKQTEDNDHYQKTDEPSQKYNLISPKKETKDR